MITISTSVAAGENEDRSGEALAELAQQVGAEIIATDVVSDDAHAIEQALRRHVDSDVALIFTTGGTGLTSDDVTPEATRAVITRLPVNLCGMTTAQPTSTKSVPEVCDPYNVIAVSVEDDRDAAHLPLVAEIGAELHDLLDRRRRGAEEERVLVAERLDAARPDEVRDLDAAEYLQW